jgi:hypothetical protein
VGYRLPHEAICFVADPPGLEPKLADPESAVLPLTPRVMKFLVQYVRRDSDPLRPKATALQAAATNLIRLARMASEAPRAGLEPTVAD